MKTKRKFIPIPKDIGDYIAYCEESSTGLINKVNRRRAIKGKEAGYIDRGYFKIKFHCNPYCVHRIVYFLCTGIDPEEKQIDHKDGDRLNNKFSNLRLATSSQNVYNSKQRKDNTSGVTGVFWSKSTEKYEVNIYNKGRLLKLGRFYDKDEAVAVRIAAETNPRFKDQEFRHPHNDGHSPSPEMLEWGEKYLEDRIERLGWEDKYYLQ
jgi:hypothetical protein